jgi:DNA polymerase/3'-5' exonuclease PolX
MPYMEAMAYATTMVYYLSPLCSRIEIAGSLRRKKETIGDIEIVLILKPEFDMFGVPVEPSKRCK